MSPTRRTLITFTAAAALGAPVARPASAQRLAYVGSVQYATGDFVFAQRTWSAYLSNGVSASAGRLRATASIPVVFQDAGLVQYSGGGMMVPSGGMGSDGTPTGSGMGTGGGMMGGSGSSDMMSAHLGLGDPIGRLELELLPGANAQRSLSVVGAVKAPFAGVSSGFGTGKWDVGGGMSAAFAFGRTSILADAVYWKLGNPSGWSLQDAVAYAVSVGRVLEGGRWSVLASITGASPIWAGLSAPVQGGAGVGYLLPSGSSIIFSAAAGLTNTAPSIATSLGWRVPLGLGR